MTEAMTTLAWAVIFYAIPLFCGRRCLGVAVFLWPVGFWFLWAGVWELMLAVSA